MRTNVLLVIVDGREHPRRQEPMGIRVHHLKHQVGIGQGRLSQGVKERVVGTSHWIAQGLRHARQVPSRVIVTNGVTAHGKQAIFRVKRSVQEKEQRRLTSFRGTASTFSNPFDGTIFRIDVERQPSGQGIYVILERIILGR